MKVEDIQHFGKEQFDALVASASDYTKGLQAIAAAYGEYSKKSIEDNNAFVEKLLGVKSLDKAVELQSEYAKSSFESFVAESKKIGELYVDLAKQAYKPFESYASKFQPAVQ